jgi:hypothetical protein
MKKPTYSGSLHLGGMVLRRRIGGVDIESAHGHGYIRLQDADLDDIIAFLQAAKEHK